MVALFFRDKSRQELLERVGHMDQVAGIKLLTAGDGLARGSRVLQVWTGTGLVFDGLADWMRFQPPTRGYREQVFHHAPVADADGRVQVCLENAALGLGLRWTNDRASLPHLFQWKVMGQGLYVLGVEPANSSGMQGRAAARQSGNLPCLAPGEIRRYALEIEAVEDSGRSCTRI